MVHYKHMASDRINEGWDAVEKTEQARRLEQEIKDANGLADLFEKLKNLSVEDQSLLKLGKENVALLEQIKNGKVKEDFQYNAFTRGYGLRERIMELHLTELIKDVRSLDELKKEIAVFYMREGNVTTNGGDSYTQDQVVTAVDQALSNPSGVTSKYGLRAKAQMLSQAQQQAQKAA